MDNFEELMSECDEYHRNHKSIESDFEINEGDLSTIWGYTPLETITSILKTIDKPKRIVVFGCSIGYQCFYFNQIYPDLQIIGIDFFRPRVDWGNSMIEKYNIQNVNLICDDISNFGIKDGDLIWQNDLLIDDDFTYNLSLFNLKNYDVTIISYKKISTFSYDIVNLKDQIIQNELGHFFQIEETKKKLETSWINEQDFYIYHRNKNKSNFDVNYIHPELIISEKSLKDYQTMNISRKDVKLELIKNLYNKNKLKDFFKKFNLKVPELYFYSNKKCDITDILSSLDSYVAKPAHMSESVGVYIKSNKEDIDEFVNLKMNEFLDISDFGNFRRSPISGGVWWKDTERGFLIEQMIKVKWELKIFVIWGEPFIGDLRTSKTELSRVDFIKKNNSYLDWSYEYDVIKKIAIELKVDFFRIDFLYDGKDLYASEIAFMPGTYLPDNIEQKILDEWRKPYFRYYYPHLC
jgi:hypothetical protein